MYRRPRRDMLEDLRFTLRVMEEDAHLGLDDEAANRLRTVLMRRISMLEGAIAHESNGSMVSGRPSIQETELLEG